MLNWLRAAFTVLVLSFGARAYGQVPVKEPDSYTRWLLSIPADTTVRVTCDFGNFRVPIGYLENRNFFYENSFAAGNRVAKFHADQQQTWKAFAFNFWVPDGGMVWHAQPQVRANRPIEPGHLSRSRESFVVLMLDMESTHIQNWRRSAMSPSPETFDVVLPARVIHPDLSTTTAYEGVTRDDKSDKLLRFYVECGTFRLCRGWLVIDRREMALSVIVPRDAVEFMFDAVKTAARLLDTWEDRAKQ